MISTYQRKATITTKNILYNRSNLSVANIWGHLLWHFFLPPFSDLRLMFTSEGKLPWSPLFHNYSCHSNEFHTLFLICCPCSNAICQFIWKCLLQHFVQDPSKGSGSVSVFCLFRLAHEQTLSHPFCICKLRRSAPLVSEFSNHDVPAVFSIALYVIGFFWCLISPERTGNNFLFRGVRSLASLQTGLLDLETESRESALVPKTDKHTFLNQQEHQCIWQQTVSETNESHATRHRREELRMALTGYLHYGWSGRKLFVGDPD